MNDRYLFKAKQKKWRELPKEQWWVQGNVIYDGVTGQYFIHAYGNSINESDKVNEEGCLCFVAYEIDASTLCQCTGLKDKNGNLIWKNDILMCHGNPKDLVKAAFGEFSVIDADSLSVIDKVIGWHYEVIPTDGISKCKPFCLSMPLTDFYIDRCEMEICGSSIDNPELPEVE